MTTELTTADLAAELARRQQEEQQEQERRAQALLEAQQAWAQDILDRHRDIDKHLDEEGAAAYKAAVAAGQRMDLAEAFTQHTRWKASREARNLIRSQAQQATAILRIDPSAALIDLRYYESPFSKFLDEIADKAAPAQGADWADELTTERPTSYEELESRRGN